MARQADAIAENVAGDFFVDSSCIDCDEHDLGDVGRLVSVLADALAATA